MGISSALVILLFKAFFLLFTGHNYAINKTTDQSTTADSWTSNLAVDGVTTIGRYSHTGFTSNEWWKVDLGETIIFQYAKIFSRSERACDKGPSNLCGKAFTTFWCLYYANNYDLCDFCSLQELIFFSIGVRTIHLFKQIMYLMKRAGLNQIAPLS